jgi:hypothetical protein
MRSLDLRSDAIVCANRRYVNQRHTPSVPSVVRCPTINDPLPCALTFFDSVRSRIDRQLWVSFVIPAELARRRCVTGERTSASSIGVYLVLFTSRSGLWKIKGNFLGNEMVRAVTLGSIQYPSYSLVQTCSQELLERLIQRYLVRFGQRRESENGEMSGGCHCLGRTTYLSVLIEAQPSAKHSPGGPSPSSSDIMSS